MQAKVQLRCSRGRSGHLLDRLKKSITEAWVLRLVPPRRCGDFTVGRRREDDPATNVGDQRPMNWSELRRAPNLCANASKRVLDRHTIRRIGIVRLNPAIKLGFLGIRQGQGARRRTCVGRDTIPDLPDEPQALGNGQVVIVQGGIGHAEHCFG